MIEPAATQYHRGIYVIITYVLVFLLYKSKSTVMRVVDYILILLSIVCIGYWIVNFEAINYRAGAETQTDQIIAMIGVLTGISGEVPTAELFQKNAVIHGITVGSRRHQLDMIAAIEANGIVPVISDTFALEAIGDAFRLQESQRHFGKICLSF